MGADIHIDPQNRFLVVTVEGTYSLAEFKETLDDITGSDQFPPDIDVLWDLRTMDFGSINVSFWRTMIDVVRQYPERGDALAVHVVDGDFAFGMLRMYLILLGLDETIAHRKTHVVRSYADAEAWLIRAHPCQA